MDMRYANEAKNHKHTKQSGHTDVAILEICTPCLGHDKKYTLSSMYYIRNLHVKNLYRGKEYETYH